LPIRYQLVLVQLSPSLYKTLLAARKRASNQLDRRQSVNGDIFSIIRMEVRPVMLAACFHKHSDDDSVKTAEFWHTVILPRIQPSRAPRQNDQAHPPPEAERGGTTNGAVGGRVQRLVVLLLDVLQPPR